MQFRESQAIYLQMAEYVCEKILLQEWKPSERIPSVRELAVQLEVNPNTVMRTYEFLQQQEMIYNERGIGFFVATEGPDRAMEYLRNQFIQKELPVLFRNLYLLKMNPSDLNDKYTAFKNNNYGNETQEKK